MEWNDFFQFLIAMSSMTSAVMAVIEHFNNRKK